jgi:uncharacterized protein YmfQ (DUF2313 family)
MPFVDAKRTQEEFTQLLANYYPSCRLFEAKNLSGTNLRKFLTGVATELWRIHKSMNDASNDYNINNTINFIEDWERVVGIPDNCFVNTGTLDERRTNVLIKLASLSVQTEADFIAVAALFGFAVEIVHPVDVGTYFPLTFPAIFFGGDLDRRFTLIVKLDSSLFPDRFPMIFPFSFSVDTVTIMECLFQKLKPANVDLLFLFD